MKITYVTSPIEYRLEGEFGFGANDSASIYKIRLQIIDLFLGQESHLLQVKCGYGEEKNLDLVEGKLYKNARKGIKIIPSKVKLPFLTANSDLIIFERFSTGFYETAFSPIPIICFVPNPLICSEYFLDCARDRAVVCVGSKIFLTFLSKIQMENAVNILQHFKDKSMSVRLKDLLISTSKGKSLDLHYQAIVNFDY